MNHKLKFDPITGKMNLVTRIQGVDHELKTDPRTGLLRMVRTSEGMNNKLKFDPATGKMGVVRTSDQGMNNKLKFDPATGKMVVVKNSDQEKNYKLEFDPRTRALKVVRVSDEDPNKIRLLSCTLRKTVPVEYKKDIEKLAEVPGECHLKEFYKYQSKHRLGREEERVKVPIWIFNSDSGTAPRSQQIRFKPLHESWKPHLDNAIKDINDAAPGLNLYITSDRSDAKVIVLGTTGSSIAFTRGNIDPNAADQALICFSDDWSQKKRTSCHELLHALFLEHEQRRSDGNKHLDYNTDGYQVVPDNDVVGITRFDPFSIMLYSENDSTFTRKAEAHPLWKLKKSTAPNVEMSEMDKVGLNIIFRPCRGPNYSPEKGSNGLWYCGRQGATEKHNRPFMPATDGKCGPENYPNCPACRVLANPTLEKIWAEDKWQGWSGFVYCGKWFGEQGPGHDGYCGPDAGPACTDCMKYM